MAVAAVVAVVIVVAVLAVGIGSSRNSGSTGKVTVFAVQ